VTYVGRAALAFKAKRYRLCASPSLKHADNLKIEDAVK
jgi:hypothetical protein